MTAISFDYSRGGRLMSPRKRNGISPLWAAAVAGVLLGGALPAAAQYKGPSGTKPKDTHELRAVAVLEWTGKAGHPKASRLIPITVWDGHELQDASVYMARPAPLALDSEVEYKLKNDGKTVGYYVVKTAGQIQGSWVGHGDWKPLPAPKPKTSPEKLAKVHLNGDNGRPILYRKNNADEESGKVKRPPRDPNRPVLTEPTKEKTQKPVKPQNEEAYVQPLAKISDPGRPRLTLGKPTDTGPKVMPALVGLPEDMHQTIAVSDAANHPEHLWKYSWASPEQEASMKADLEAIARKDLSSLPQPAATKPADHKTAHKGKKPSRKAEAKLPQTPPTPTPLLDEKFQVFALTYGAGPTMVFSAHTGSTPEKFITLIAQPDLYGHVSVLLKNVTDAAHLDDTPAMHLIGPVDAMADHRGELLFELRGATHREFALYRVLLGRVQKLFTSAPEVVVAPQEGTTAG